MLVKDFLQQKPEMQEQYLQSLVPQTNLDSLEMEQLVALSALRQQPQMLPELPTIEELEFEPAFETEQPEPPSREEHQPLPISERGVSLEQEFQSGLPPTLSASPEI